MFLSLLELKSFKNCECDNVLNIFFPLLIKLKHQTQNGADLETSAAGRTQVWAFNATLWLKKWWNKMRGSVWTARLVPVPSPQEGFRTCHPAWETPPARLCQSVGVEGWRLQSPPASGVAAMNVRVPAPPLTSAWALSKLLLFCGQLYSTSIFHSALSPGERTSRRKKGLWRRSEGRGSFLRAGGRRGNTGWDGTDRSEALQPEEKRIWIKTPATPLLFQNWAPRVRPGSSSEVSNSELLVCLCLLYLAFPPFSSPPSSFLCLSIRSSAPSLRHSAA